MGFDMGEKMIKQRDVEMVFGDEIVRHLIGWDGLG